MKTQGKHISLQDPVKAVTSLVLVAVMLFLASGDLLLGVEDHGCDSKCCESCQDETDCAGCLRTIQIVAVLDSDQTATASTLTWTIPSISYQSETCLVYQIDHPPQNMS